MQAERRINCLKSSLDEREKELTTAVQKHQEALSASAAADTTIKQLEEAVQRYAQRHAVHTHTGFRINELHVFYLTPLFCGPF